MKISVANFVPWDLEGCRNDLEGPHVGKQISIFGQPENGNSHYHNHNIEELDIWKIIVNVGKHEQISTFGQPENLDRLVSKHSACNTFLILTHFDSEAEKKVKC